MTAPATLAPDIMIGAAEIARFLCNSDEFQFRHRVYDLCTRSKRPLPHVRLGSSRIATRRVTLIDWIAMQEGLAHDE